MSELVPGLSYEVFRDEALAHQTETSFRESDFFARYGEAILELLSTPRIERCEETGTRRSLRPDPGATDSGSLRVVHWNIEKGKRIDAIRDRLTHDPELRCADLYTLNEVDVGMARSGGNADIGRELARALGCHLVFVPGYIECTKGPGEEAASPGENDQGLHGLAILSRLPVLDAAVSPLPRCFDYFDFFEKRFGFRQGLYATVEFEDRPIVVGTTHLEVRNTPSCRARQFRRFLDGLDSYRPGQTEVILTGDWNTNSFRRGGLLHSGRELLRILSTPRDRLASEFIRPIRREPLFRILEKSGFDLEPFNDREPTAAQMLGKAEELDLLPRFLADFLAGRLDRGKRNLEMRLDWIAARGFRATSPPRTRSATGRDGVRASDHALIQVDLAPTG